jgi:hypothetical protein
MAPPPNLDRLLETSHFPGMTAAESRLIREFLARRGATWDTADVERRTRARPDLILKRAPDYVAIVEAKEQLTNEGVWQVLGYRDLWLADHPADKVECIVIAEAFVPNAAKVAKAYGVKVYIYEFPDRALPSDPGVEVTP